MRFHQLLAPEHLLAGAAARDAEDAIGQLLGLLAADGTLPDPGRALALVLEREQSYPTGLGAGVALPHCNGLPLVHFQAAAGVFPAGVDFGAPDGPARVVILLLSPPEHAGTHLKLLARVSRLAHHGLCDRLLSRSDPAALAQGFAEAEQDLADM